MIKIHINRHIVEANRKRGGDLPPISVIRDGQTTRTYGIELIGNARIVYQPDRPLACGAGLWIEADDVLITDRDTKFAI